MIYRAVTMEIHRLVLLMISFMLFASKVRSESFCPISINENLRNIVLMDSHVVVGSTSALYRLNPSLSERQQTRTLSSPNRMLVGDPNGTYSDSVLECGNSGCSLRRISDLADVRWEVSSGVLRSATDEVVGIFAAGPNGTSSLHIGERAIPTPTRRSIMSKGDLVNVDSSSGDQFDPYAYQDEGIDTRQREFLTSFRFQNFVYFVFRIDHMFTSGSEIRLVRFCQEDRGGFDLGDTERPRFASRYEAVLDCQSSDGNGILMATAGYSATFINSPEPFGTETVLVSFGNFIGMGGSATQYTSCAFNLTLINDLMQRKYDTCIAGGVTGDNMVGFIRDGQQVCPTLTAQQLTSGITECNFAGILLSGLEVKNPVTPISQTAFLSHELRGYFTTLVHTPLDEVNFLFAGSSEGILFQFQITSSSSAQFIRAITLDVPTAAGPSETNVTRLLASQDGKFIYALTPKKLFRHPVDVCEELISCSECVDHPDPICGWCTLQGRCTREVNCLEVTPGRTVWVTNSSVCPVISNANPSTIYLPDLTEGLMITLTVANIPEDLSYRCVFDFGSPANTVVGSLQTLTVETGDVICVAPTRADIPPIPSGQDTVNSTVSLRYQEVDFVTQQEPISFTNCSVHTSCTACITSAQGCGWCPFTFRCISPGSMCGVDSEEVSVTQGCPSIQPHTITGDYLLHINVSYDEPPLNIEGTNLEVFETEFNNNEFMCEVCTGEGTSQSCRRVPAQLSAGQNQVHCMIEQNQFTYQGPEATLTATLNVVWTIISRNIDNPTGAGVILYSCKRMGTNCGQCLALPSQFGCSYCDAETPPRRTCAFTQQCSPGDIIVDISRIGECEQPQILSFTPTAGPPDGGTEITITGTNLGAQQSDVTSVQIGTGSSNMVACEVTGYVPGISITCTTNGVGSMTQPQPIVVQFSYVETPVASAENFVFVEPTLERPFPVMGPRSGGTRLTIVGRFLDIGSTASVEVSDQNCPIDSIDATSIVCTTPAIAEEQMGVVIRVSVDDWSGELNNIYDYVSDPTFESILPLVSFIDGGTNYTITGTGLNTVLEPRLLYYITSSPEAGTRRRRRQQPSQGTTVLVSESCTAQSATVMRCPAPGVNTTLAEGDRMSATIGLRMDGVENLTMLGVGITVYPNPTFSQFTNVRSFSQNDDIFLTIEGSGFLFTSEQVAVDLTPCNTESCPCIVQSVNSTSSPQTITCNIDNPNNLPVETPITVTIRLGNQNVGIGLIELEPPLNLLIILIPAFAGVIVIAAAIFIVVVAVFCRKTRQKDQRYDQLILELEKLESSVARECKLGFAELQTDLDELTGDVSGVRLPYTDLQNYMMANLFPGAKDHPTLHDVQVPSHQRAVVVHALRDFQDLLLDKKVLLIFIRSLEEQRGFTIRDKSIVGSLLMVILHQRLDYATEILKSLLSELIRRTVAQSYPKLLLRRTESVAERMLTNWLAFCLHDYIMEHAGQPLYLLYRAVKNQLEKGPIDVITGEARYSLSEQKLIRQKMDVEVINAMVECEDELRVPVKLLNCDTVSQAKEKLLDAVYKAAPVTQRPSLTSVDLEHLRSPQDVNILRDEDAGTVLEGGWKRINTLRHYLVEDAAIFRLRRRKDHAPPGRTWDYPASLISTHCPRQRALSEAEDGTRVWHLFKQLDVEDPRRSPFLSRKMVTEIYLPRMLSTKSILQKFVDDLFNSLFTLSHPPSSPNTVYNSFFPRSPGVNIPMGYAPGADAVPMAIKYLFDFLDDEAENARIADPDVRHTWKNNALSLRFWVNMIKNPEFMFDINKSHTVDACLSVIAQAFIDGCSTAESKLTIDSPTSKLLYNKEVQAYKTKVKKYYDEVSQLPRVPEDAMQYYLKQLSTYQAQLMKKNGGFITDSAIYELLRYGMKYHEQLLTNLRMSGLESKAQLFESILRVTM